MKKIIPLKGEGRRVLRLAEEASASAASVSPAAEGRLWLCDEEGRLYSGELCDGRCSVSGAGFIGAAITRYGTVTHTGGFAGREALRARALAEIRMRTQKGACGERQAEIKQERQREQTEEPGQNGPAQERQRPQKQPQREDARQRSAALLEILQKAQELFSPLEKEQPACEREEGERMLNPFPQAFPFSRWKRVEYPGTDSYYLEGETVKNGAVYAIYALPGEYRSRPRAKGFDKFLRSRDGSGYWIRVTSGLPK